MSIKSKLIVVLILLGIVEIIIPVPIIEIILIVVIIQQPPWFINIVKEIYKTG